MRNVESLDPVTSDQGTILVFGGVTFEGYEDARKLADGTASLGRKVIWFDGFTGDKSAHPPSDGLLVVDYGERERNRRFNRMERTDGAGRFAARLLKRWNTATRGYASWRLIRRDVSALSKRLTPSEIIYCDDHALTAAWHAARLWPETPVRRAPT